MKLVTDYANATQLKLKAPYEMKPEYITVHNTFNDAPAINEINYMKNNTSQTGFHVAVDDVEARIGIPFNRNAFHCGDGANGDGNRKSIGVEICYSKSGGTKYYKAEENSIELVAGLLYEFGFDIKRVKKHQDWSGKYCPHRILDEKKWDDYLKRVDKRLMEMKGGNDMTKYEPNSKSLMDNTVKYLEGAVKEGKINQSHVDALKSGTMTVSHLLGVDITIRMKDKE